MPSRAVSKEFKVPRMSYPVTALVSLLSQHASSPWYVMRRIKRGSRNHRPAWTTRYQSRTVGGFEIAECDFHRALSIGVVEAKDLRVDDIEGSEVGRRAQIRVTALGRAALVVAEAKENQRAEAKAAKGIGVFAPAGRPILIAGANLQSATGATIGGLPAAVSVFSPAHLAVTPPKAGP